ncbi:ribonuclease H-like domain-containing protein [Tanacetum coccineum]
MAGGDANKDKDKGVSGSSDLNLTFSDPLYLHPNDIGGSPIVTIKLTGTENYKVWSITMTFALRNHNKIGFIDGTCKKDDSNPALANQWDMCNSVVFTWILNSLSPDLYAGAIYAKTASELWTDLKDTYDKVDGSAVFNLHKSINSLSQSGASLDDYYNNLNSLWKQFDAMISLPACTCDAAEHFEKHNQLIKLMQFLMGLDDNYLAIRSNILTREPLPLEKADFAIISGEEGSNSGSNSNNRGPNPNLNCTNCNKIGHTVHRCFEIIGYPAGYVKRNFNSNSKSVGTSNNSDVDPNSNIAGKNSLNIKGTFFNGSVKFNLNFKRFFNGNTDFIVGNISLGWIVDSGANQHMTVSAKFLVNVVGISNLGLTVGHPNGTQALITKIGDLKLNDNITLYDVLVVPEYTVSLISVHKLSRDNKLFVGFDDNHCYIQDLKANKNVGIGRQFNGLYLFDVDSSCKKFVSNNCISSCFVSKTLWHQRLGHPADQVLDILKTTLNLDSQSAFDHLCDTCNKAKQTREPFPLSDHKSSKIGELVHLDVWGPYKITSRDGFKYFLTIVDDFSRAVWVYMLKGKDDVYDSIVSFV